MPSLRALAADALLDAWALLQPVDCAGCGAPDRGVCPPCRTAAAPALHTRAVQGLAAPVHAAGDYSGPRRSLLLAGKEHGRADALRALAPSLGAAVLAALDGAGPGAVDPGSRIELAWVPSTREALHRRGLDPVLLMLRAAGLPASRVLVARAAGPQKRLDRDGRAAAAGGRFRPRGVLEGRRFLLVDDVVTTGSTVAAAAAALAAGGGAVVGVACAASVELAAAPLAGGEGVSRMIRDTGSAPG